MISLLAGIGDYVLAEVPRPLAFLLRLPVLVCTAFFLLWASARGALRVTAVGMRPLSNLVAHGLWYVLLMPEAWMSKRAVKRNHVPGISLYTYGEQVESLAIATRTTLRYVARLLVSVSRTPSSILFALSIGWAAVTLLATM
jgi:hypothetical protein